jgi:large subunit ribosomal protein L30
MFAVIRVRGSINMNPDIKKTLNLLNLTRVNHCVLVEDTKIIRGMLQVAKDYITWGEVDKKMLVKLIEARGRLKGDKELSVEYLKSATSYASWEKLSDALLKKEFKYKEIPDVKPIFRLNPPVKGYEGIKRSFINKGALGYRGKEINSLLERMV